MVFLCAQHAPTSALTLRACQPLTTTAAVAEAADGPHFWAPNWQQSEASERRTDGSLIPRVGRRRARMRRLALRLKRAPDSSGPIQMRRTRKASLFSLSLSPSVSSADRLTSASVGAGRDYSRVSEILSVCPIRPLIGTTDRTSKSERVQFLWRPREESFL